MLPTCIPRHGYPLQCFSASPSPSTPSAVLPAVMLQVSKQCRYTTETAIPIQLDFLVVVAVVVVAFPLHQRLQYVVTSNVVTYHPTVRRLVVRVWRLYMWWTDIRRRCDSDIATAVPGS
ncbi:hypothetical protein K402DRAFT_159266 [Aulographum hederae CBS 113979]|uniref:Uncharacterized protein n=1 Tax=Aulographum hederae CBS 113979 TaxID=1176131 RepID=A0A6G1GRS6_9PEZI|nr:hypothetical protein K402DRAFT_159266 [Aulographum hederae CBS 113979]